MYPDPNQQQQPLNQSPQQMPPQGPPPQQPQYGQQPTISPLPDSVPPLSDYTHPIIDPPKHSYHPKRFMIALGVFVGICIIGVGVMLAFALMPQSPSKPKTSTSKDTSKTSSESTLTAATAIKHVKEYFKGTEVAKSPIMRPIKAPDTNYYTVVSDVAPLVSVAGAVAPDKASAQIDSIVHSLDGDGFTKTVVTDGSGKTNYQAYFVRKDVICEADLAKPADAKANQWIEAKCLDMSVYSTYANDQAGFANIYTPLSATSVLYGFVGKATITDGSVAGYKRGKIQVSTVINDQMTTDGKFAVYYQTPDGIWHYFADQDNVAIECEKYTTKDQQSAYSGTPCRSLKTGAMSTVPVPKKGSY